LNSRSSSGSLGQLAWKRFRKNRIAFGSFCFIILVTLIAIAGYLVTPDQTPMANEQNLILANRKPGSSIQVLKIHKNEAVESRSFLQTMLYGRKNPYTELPVVSWRFGSSSLFVIPYEGELTPGKEMEISFPQIVYPLDMDAGMEVLEKTVRFTTLSGNSLEEPLQQLRERIREDHLKSRVFLLGTDRYGRDVLSQLLIGTRVSLSVGFIAVLLSLVLGIFLGSIAGYFGGLTDNIIVWLINVIWAIPTLLLVIAITFALGKGFWQVFVAVGLTMWVEVARIVRGQFISLREKDFVEAAAALGYRRARIIFRHILPNALSPVIVISAANFASAILLEAGLSFLGIGVQPPMPSWGTMVRENYAYIILDYAYLAILPGVAIMIMVLAFMMIGNGLRDALDVRTGD